MSSKFFLNEMVVDELHIVRNSGDELRIVENFSFPFLLAFFCTPKSRSAGGYVNLLPRVDVVISNIDVIRAY